MITTLVSFFATLACLLGIFFIAAVVEAALLRLFPSSYPNVRNHDDNH